MLEAWIGDVPPDSLSLHATVPRSKLSDSCQQALVKTAGLQGVRSCGDTSASPSHQSGGSSPNLVALVHISGSATHPFRILENDSTRTLGEIRLWSVESSDSLVFRGLLGLAGDSIGRLPSLTQQRKYVLEAWTPGSASPRRIAVRRRSSLSDTTWNAFTSSTCPVAVNLASLGPSTISLFGCSMASSPFPEDGADVWSAVAFWPL
jgi:hypothetical protein